MKKRIILAFSLGILCTILLIPFISGKNSFKSSDQSINITIAAAISLKDSLQEIKTIYQQNHPEIQITYNFGSSGSLQQQIEQGAPIDIFISASKKQMDALESKNLLLTESRNILVTNQLVLITQKDEKNVQNFADLTKTELVKIALGEPKSVPAGQYGEQVLKYYKIYDQIKSKLIYSKDVRQILTYVETNNVNAGLVYITDAKTSNQVRIVATAPPNSHVPIIYPLAVLKDSKNIKNAQELNNFLLGAIAQNIFKKYGFGTKL
jgi:molybdate transport system substrate-binding protein